MKGRDERGQATVEFALIIPLVVVAILVVIQVTMVAHAQLGVTHLAREAARALAADPTVDVGLLMQQQSPWGTEDMVIEVHFEPSPMPERKFVVVVIHYQTAHISRLFEPFATQLEVSSQVKMLTES